MRRSVSVSVCVVLSARKEPPLILLLFSFADNLHYSPVLCAFFFFFENHTVCACLASNLHYRMILKTLCQISSNTLFLHFKQYYVYFYTLFYP